MLLKQDILINQVTHTTRHIQILIVLGLLTSILLTGMFTANAPTKVFADSRLLKQDTKQATNCDTVGANSPISVREQQIMSTMVYQRLVRQKLQEF